MSQHDMDVANAAGATVRADLNAALVALVGLSSGAAAPGTMFAYQWWADTTNNVLKQRNAANSAWRIRGTLDTACVLAKTGTYTIALADFGKVIDATSGTWSLGLLAAATAGDGYTIGVRNSGSGTITIDPDSSELIDGASTLALAAGQSCLLYCNGTAWKTVGYATAGSTPAYGIALSNGKLAWSVGSSALTVAVKTLAGSDPSAGDPVKVEIPDGSGGVNVRTITAALSLVISSGSTLGTANSTPFRIRIGALDNSGTVELFAYNTVSGTTIKAPGEYETVTTTAEGGAGAADSAQTAYSTTARTTKQFRWIGFGDWSSGLATAGTWSAGPAVAHLQGVGQPLPGEQVGLAISADGAVATGTTVMPQDDTIPQNTEGDQYMTVTYPRRSAVNLLDIEHVGYYSQSAGTYLVNALFQDATASALAAGMRYNPSNANVHPPTPLRHRKLCGASGNTTFNVRAGPSSAATVTFNGLSGGRQLGGVMSSHLTVRELAA